MREAQLDLRTRSSEGDLVMCAFAMYLLEKTLAITLLIDLSGFQFEVDWLDFLLSLAKFS